MRTKHAIKPSSPKRPSPAAPLWRTISSEGRRRGGCGVGCCVAEVARGFCLERTAAPAAALTFTALPSPLLLTHLAHAQATIAKGALNSKCLWLHDNAYGLLLKECCFAKAKSSAAALARLESAFSELGFPLGDKGAPVFVKVFQEIYDRDVMTEDCLKKWREDIHNTTPGHDKALQQTQRWFEWLENAEEEEGEGDEGEEAEEADELKGILKPDNKRTLR